MTAVPDPSTWKLPRLAIDRDGAWLAEDGEVTHPGLLAHLRDNLRVDGQGHYLQVGPVRVPVQVEDAPYVVVRVELEPAPGTVILNDLSREPLRVETLVFGPGEIPYCRVRDGRFEACFSRAAAWELLQFVEHDDSVGGPVLVLPGLRHLIPTIDRGQPAPSR